MEWMLMPLKRYAEFSGRSRRMEYWMFTLGVFLLFMALTVVALMIGFGAAMSASSSGSAAGAGAGLVGVMASMGLLGIVIIILGLGLLIPSIAVAVRRLHDTDRSGWWLLLPLAPYVLVIAVSVAGAAAQSQALLGIAMLLTLLQWVASIVLLVFYCLPGTAGPNKYGPDPINPAADLSETFR